MLKTIFVSKHAVSVVGFELTKLGMEAKMNRIIQVFHSNGF